MAQKLRFRLSAVLRVRRAREREARRRFAAKNAEIAQVDRLNRQTAEEIRARQEDLLAEQHAAVVDPVALVRERAWIGYLRGTIVERQRLLASLLGELERLRAELHEARRQTRVIEKLRERKLAEHRRQIEREEQAASDELARQLPCDSAET